MPRVFRDYIHDIATRDDPQFRIRELNECRLQREQSIAKIEELKNEVERRKPNRLRVAPPVLKNPFAFQT